jgi:hypothetical protein
MADPELTEEQIDTLIGLVDLNIHDPDEKAGLEAALQAAKENQHQKTAVAAARTLLSNYPEQFNRAYSSTSSDDSGVTVEVTVKPGRIKP